jgi:hypothetical protein
MVKNAKDSHLAEIEAKIKNLLLGVQAYNLILSEQTRKNGDAYVDIATCVSPHNMAELLVDFGLLPGSEPVGTSKKFVSGAAYDAAKPHTEITTSDKVHPTDKVYEVIWTKVQAVIKAQQYAFGKLS